MKNTNRDKRKPAALRRRALSRRGAAALVTVMVFGTVLLALVAGLTRTATYQTRDRARYEIYKDEFNACETAVNYAYAHIRFLVQYGVPPRNETERDDPELAFSNRVNEASQNPPNIEGFQIDRFNIVETEQPGFNDIPVGQQWGGLRLYQRKYRIDVMAKCDSDMAERFSHPGVALSQALEITYVPLHVFAIFYDDALELHPGPDMTINGLVHANGDFFICSKNSISFEKAVTVAGLIDHGLVPNHQENENTFTGNVRFTDGFALQDMGQNGVWLDSTQDDWVSASINRWSHHVRDSNHGVTPMDLPIPSEISPDVIIQRPSAGDIQSVADEKLANKAGLYIEASTDGGELQIRTAVDGNGNPVDLNYYVDPDGNVITAADYREMDNPPDNLTEKWIVELGAFYDEREGNYSNPGRRVWSVDVNVANMVESGITPTNGIMYVSNDVQNVDLAAVRVVNGERLPGSVGASGFSLATDNPLYILGDYNTVNRTLSMVAADALTILSNDWDDSQSHKSVSKRRAAATSVNAVVLTGHVWDDQGTGGAHNFPRFLENWSSRNFNFSGSFVQLWRSQRADTRWVCCPHYNPPRRNYSWDTALGGLNAPPGAPRVVHIQKTQWSLTGMD